MAVKQRFAIWQIILEELSWNRADGQFDYHGWLCRAASPGAPLQQWGKFMRGIAGFFLKKMKF